MLRRFVGWMFIILPLVAICTLVYSIFGYAIALQAALFVFSVAAVTACVCVGITMLIP